ncbi:nucleotide exchange factor GrpE [Acrocarpospora sp. B8E8]|uniref:nucleotide exchange factor GrpE n=1 Tax=Acrocarpospora sp. B8E8 TaxID=3153572 RepID=UPI00325F053E
MTSSTPNSPPPNKPPSLGDDHPADTGAATGPNAKAGVASGAEPDPKVAELEERLLRAAADMDNLRKRMAKEIERERARATAEWLPVLDNLELALKHAKADPEAVLDGLRAVHEQALAVMNRLGYPRQDDEGAPFDPERHDAVGTVPATTTRPGTVAEVVRPGYGALDRRLRPAAVVVATKGE